MLVGVGVLSGLVAVWSVAVAERRPVLTGSEWGDRVGDACADLRTRTAAVSDAASDEELVEKLRAQGEGVALISTRLRFARPDAAVAGRYRQAVDTVARWRAVSEELADRLDRTPALTLGGVARGLAADARAAREADRALERLGGRTCLAVDLDPVGGGAAARTAGEALLGFSGLRRVAEAAPACVAARLEAVPFGVAAALERGDVTSEAVEALSGALDGCLRLRPLLERIFADLGHERMRARCLAGEVASRSGWLQLVETVIDEPVDRFTAAVAAGLEICV